VSVLEQKEAPGHAGFVVKPRKGRAIFVRLQPRIREAIDGEPDATINRSGVELLPFPVF